MQRLNEQKKHNKNAQFQLGVDLKSNKTDIALNNVFKESE